MQTKHLCVLIHICTRDGVGHPWGWFGPFTEVFLLSVSGWCFFVDHLCYFCLVFVMLSCASVCWCLVVTCLERADLLALVCAV